MTHRIDHPAKTNTNTGTARTLRPKMLRARPPANMVNVSKEDFPALKKKIRSGVNVKEGGDNAGGMHQTRNGALLIEIRDDSATVAFVRAEISRASGEGIVVKPL